MKKYRHETVAGIFMLAGLIGVGYLTVKLGNVKWFGNDSYSLYARFNSVSGLRPGNAVEMLGIEIGEVSGFRLDQDKLVVMTELRIRKGIKIYDDAFASIKTVGLIGDKHVSIDPGGGGALLKLGGTILQTESPPDLWDLIRKYAFGDIEKGGKEKK
jgi:phospholipid/cholesterol/gamma-HCH transport system substrate-binding protein